MNGSRRPGLATLAVATALLLASFAAGAVPLDNGFTSQPFLDTSLPGTTFAARPELGGVVIADTDTPFTLGDISGFVQNRVVRESGTGTLDFYWRVEVDPGTSASGIGALRLGDFGYGYLTDADWRIDGLGTVPASTARLFNPATVPQGDINFLFGGNVTGGESSSFFFLHTSATNFAPTGVYDLVGSDNSISSIFDTYAPAAAVPEPAPAMLLAIGLLTLGLLRSRRAARRD